MDTPFGTQIRVERSSKMGISEAMQAAIAEVLEESASQHNQNYADAYEIATAMHIHHMTGSKHNTDPEHQRRIGDLNKKGADAFEKLPEHLRKRAMDAAHSSAKSYVESLHKNHGIHPDDVHEVHHTSKGISHLVGHKVPQNEAPHDVVVKTKSGKMHGASLKATQGTASNNSPENVVPGLNDHYKKHAEMHGLGDKTKHERKDAVANDSSLSGKAKSATVAAAKKHKEHFDTLSHDDQKEHIHKLMRYNKKPHINLDYVNGEKGKSTPYHELPHIKASNEAHHFSIEHDPSSNMTKIHAHMHDGRKIHLLTVEHRYTHGAFNAPQANAKFSAHKE
jgi:hypothetical protein